MGAEKRLQRKLNRMGKKKGNTVDIKDGGQEVGEFIQEHGTKGQKRRATKLYDKINKGSGIKMISPLEKKKTSCWTGYSNIVDGKPTYKKKGDRTVPDCKPIN